MSRGYGVADGRGLRTVLEHSPGDVCALAMNHSHLEGTLGDGPSCYMFQKNSRSWAVRRDAGEKGTASYSRVLQDGWSNYFHSSTNGDYIAVTMADGHSNWAFLLARIQDWNIRYIPNDWPAWFAMDSKHLYTMSTRRDKYAGRRRCDDSIWRCSRASEPLSKGPSSRPKSSGRSSPARERSGRGEPTWRRASDRACREEDGSRPIPFAATGAAAPSCHVADR